LPFTAVVEIRHDRDRKTQFEASALLLLPLKTLGGTKGSFPIRPIFDEKNIRGGSRRGWRGLEKTKWASSQPAVGLAFLARPPKVHRCGIPPRRKGKQGEDGGLLNARTKNRPSGGATEKRQANGKRAGKTLSSNHQRVMAFNAVEKPWTDVATRTMEPFWPRGLTSTTILSLASPWVRDDSSFSPTENSAA